MTALAEDVEEIKGEQVVQNDRIGELERRPAVDKSLTRRVENLEAAAEGNLYRVETDDETAYEKAVQPDVLPWGTLDKVGGKTLVMNQLVKNPNFDGKTVGQSRVVRLSPSLKTRQH